MIKKLFNEIAADTFILRELGDNNNDGDNVAVKKVILNSKNELN
jgi:hypothetical protein